MKIKSFIFNPFQENTYVIYDQTKECLIIDPGCYTKEEENILNEFILKKELKPVKIINTHCHIDHILGNNFAGIDIIGEYLTEINITSPTCAREILDQTDMNPISEYFQGL